MVLSEGHLQRILDEIAQNPGLVLFTLANPPLRRQLENRCRVLGLPVVAALDPVNDSMSNILGQETRNRTGRKYIMDEAYFARIDAIQSYIAHDAGLHCEYWKEHDTVHAGVYRFPMYLTFI